MKIIINKTNNVTFNFLGEIIENECPEDALVIVMDEIYL